MGLNAGVQKVKDSVRVWVWECPTGCKHPITKIPSKSRVPTKRMIATKMGRKHMWEVHGIKSEALVRKIK